jgi:NADH-quinone oxidoreductase subunit C
MDERLEQIVNTLKPRYGIEAQEFRGEVTLVIPPQHLPDICKSLRDEFHFNMLIDETAVDYWPRQEPRFHMVYQLYSMDENLMICLRVPLNGNAPTLPTLESVYPNANWHEREVWDMFGIKFDGHSDLRRILMPEDWQGHPQRKDYPLGYEEVQFTFNFDQISLKKPAPKE